MRFAYKAKHTDGKTSLGSVNAADMDSARKQLLAQDLYPFVLTEETERRGNSRVGLRTLRTFASSLAVLLESGAVLSKALQSLSTDTEDAGLCAVIKEISSAIAAGETFSNALLRYPTIFDKLFISLVKTGEQSGSLARNLRAASEVIEQRLEFRSAIQSMSVYPAVIACVGVLTVVVLLTVIVPKMTVVYQELGKELPLITRMVLGAAQLFASTWFLSVPFCVAAAWAVAGPWRAHAQRVLLTMQYRCKQTRDLAVKTNLTYFSSSVSTMLSSGTNLGAALDIVASSHHDIFFTDALRKATEGITHGRSFSQALTETGYFPKAFVNAVTVGEDSGTLAKVLASYAVDLRQETQRSIKTVTSLFEPAIILIVGLAVGFIVIAMLLPIFDIDVSF